MLKLKKNKKINKKEIMLYLIGSMFGFITGLQLCEQAKIF